MRNRILLTSLACGLLVAASSAQADEVRTTHTTKILKRPGEQSPVVIRVSAGHEMTVLEEQGRWIKVRVEGHTGWVTRTSVESTAEAREVQRNTRRRPFVDGRSLRRGWSGDAPDDRVGEDATGADDEAAPASDDDDDTARPKKKVAAKKVKARHDADADEADDDEDAPKPKKHAKKHTRSRDDGDDDEAAASDGDDDEASADDEEAKEPEKKMMTVTADEVDLRSKPSKKSRALLTVGKGDRLAFVEESDDGKWVEVENEDGDSGWIRAKDVAADGHKEREIHLDARLGFASIGESFKSNGTGGLANYNLGSAAVAVALAGSADWKYGTNYRIGADLSYVMDKATPGVRYNDGTNAADIGFTTHDIDARLKVGYDLHSAKGTVLWGRAGYHYGMFSVDNVGDLTKNLAHLPSEILSGPTVGFGMDMPKLGEKVGARATADLLYPGTRSQTKGLEDGAASKAMAAWVTAVVSYQWKDDLTLDAGYRLGYASTQWAGAATGSMRGTNATTAARTDLSHILTIGLAKSF
ncbi:MAG TPA: SH3 domain-containing protein [Kofleriaceae bacterium]|jgi:uncharacterized protein YgiM (DUF1202 family)|nr:SH3 domain-containing protein [Kofleriaceae bacterium]